MAVQDHPARHLMMLQRFDHQVMPYMVEERTDGILRAVVIDLQPTILQVADQLVPFIVQVVQRLAGRTGGRYLRQRFIQPATQLIQDRPRMPLAVLRRASGSSVRPCFSTRYSFRIKASPCCALPTDLFLPCALTASSNLRRACAMQPTCVSAFTATTAL